MVFSWFFSLIMQKSPIFDLHFSLSCITLGMRLQTVRGRGSRERKRRLAIWPVFVYKEGGPPAFIPVTLRDRALPGQISLVFRVYSSMKLLVTLTGLVLILEGLPYVAGPEAMQEWLKRLIEMKPEQLRLVGIIAMGIGFFLCFVAQRTDLFG